MKQQSNKYKGKYRIATTRASFWDYSWNGAYFVTLCTRNRIHYFGQVLGGKDTPAYVALSPMGEIAHRCWLEIPAHFPFVRLEAFVIMPDHVHGIIIIEKPEEDAPSARAETEDLVETENLPSQRRPEGPKNRFGPQSKNLASIVRGFKVGVTKNARQLDPTFSWQPLYYDHIIQDGRAFENISLYIQNNPAAWAAARSGPRGNR